MSKLNESTLEKYRENFAVIERQLADPEITVDTEKMMKISRERARLLPKVELIEKRARLLKQLTEVKEQLTRETDPEFKEVLDDELKTLKEDFETTEDKLQIEMLPEDPDAGKNIFVEIRAGTGGDEAGLFARDLYRMYLRYLEKQENISVESVTTTETGIQGLKEAVFLVKGPTAYDLLHFEAGTHRVQRIPETESGGRIHTSACTVAVIPEAEEHELQINQNELRIDVYRSSGPGGQSVNTTDSAVRITHLPTGLVVSCQDEKSQIKNKAKAMSILRARLAEKQKEEQHEKMAAEKKAQIGSGDRSEKIRTYNFPQSRVTDHRINYTAHNLDQVMQGELTELIEALQNVEREKKLALLEEAL